MDVRIWAVGITLIFLSACSQSKTTDSVFSSDNSSQSCSGNKLNNSYIVEWEDGHFSKETSSSLDHFKENFVQPNLDAIKFIESDRVVKAEDVILSPELSSIDASTGPTNTWGADITEAANLWSNGIVGNGVIVGVVDARVDSTHPQLVNQTLVGKTFISDPDDDGKLTNGHGTHVSGIIAADHSVAGPMKGMAPKAKILPAPFIGSSGSGSLGDAIVAMQYVASKGAKVINASWGGAPCVSSLRTAFEQIQNQGVLIVVAAGNSSHDIDVNPEYPAAFGLPGQITVAAATSNDFMASYSNLGFTLVHLAAPGSQILSTTPNDTYSWFDGTSMAAPFVTGAVALLWSAKPTATAAQIKQAILKGVDVTSGHEYKTSSRGRLNVRKAFDELAKLVP